jgi:hypothetical protein
MSEPWLVSAFASAIFVTTLLRLAFDTAALRPKGRVPHPLLITPEPKVGPTLPLREWRFAVIFSLP